MTGSKQRPNLRVKDILLLTAIAALTVLIVALLMLRGEKNLAKANIRNSSQRAANEFQRIVEGVEGFLLSARNYGVDPANIDAAAHYFRSSVFPHIKKLAGVALAEKDGESYYFQWDDTHSDIRVEEDVNPVTMEWFDKALKNAGTNQWTGIHELRTGEQGISVSLSWTGKSGCAVVTTYDISMDSFFTAVQQLAPTPSGVAFIFLPDGTLYAPEGKDQERPVDSGMEGMARKGLAVWKKQVQGSDISTEQVLSARIDGQIWWCGFVPLEKSRRAVWLGVMVPKSDLVDDIAVQRRIYVGVGVIVFVAIAAIYLLFPKRPLKVRFDPEMNAGEIRALIDQGENSSVEFKSTMRMNLHSKKPGREIEQAWLKGVAAFLNTNGGILLLGVTDAGEVTGLEQDVFESDDKCRLHFKNLIAKGLGADLSRYIRFTLVPIEGKTVGVVQCVKASRPVYLRDGNKEAFYIRNGPSSDELPASRMVEYIAENWE